MEPLGTGDLAPDFELASTAGERHRLADALARGPVLLFFFKIDCATSALAAPFAERISVSFAGHESAEGTRLSVLGVSQDGASETRDFAASTGLGFPLLVDAQLETSESYRLRSTPTLFLLRGVERLRSDSDRVAAEEARRIADRVEGWSRSGYELCAEEIAARIGGLPPEIFDGAPELPESRPG